MKKFIGLLFFFSLHANSGTLTDPVERTQGTLLVQIQSALKIIKADSLSGLDQDELKQYTLAEIIEIAKESKASSISAADILGFTDPPGIIDEDDND